MGVSGVFYPGGPGSITDAMVQAFVYTDVVAAGLLAFGQHVELQWQGAPGPERPGVGGAKSGNVARRG